MHPAYNGGTNITCVFFRLAFMTVYIWNIGVLVTFQRDREQIDTEGVDRFNICIDYTGEFKGD